MNLEDFIKTNIDEFDTEEPRDGHFERFAERINKKHRKITILRWSASVAVSVILLATVGILRQNPIPVCNFSDEVVELQNYYESTLNAEIDRVEKLIAMADFDIRTDMAHDIAQIKIETGQIPSDICGDSGDNAVAVLVEFYQNRITALRYMSGIIENQLSYHKI